MIDTPRSAAGRAAALMFACAAILPAPGGAQEKMHKPLAPAFPHATVVNPGFESPQPAPNRTPPGWFSIQHAGELSYTFSVDATVAHSGRASLRIDNVGAEPFGSTYQQVAAVPYRGRRLRFSGWLRTENARGSATGNGAVLMMQATQNGALLAWNHMADKAVHGTAEWQLCSIELDVPEAAEQVEIGVMLHGPGRLWFDDADLVVLPRG